ncbi:unnamed protein product [Sphagnum jensenii]|uniref:HTH cro/C1-type domain-containing protein n=1 Tax=Sphagnum jensenii TaxID=128206 RepID=A0ABP0VC44_9BRYO
MDFAHRLKDLMRKRGLRTVDLARGIDRSPKTLSDWLAGRLPRDFEGIRAAAKFLGVSVHYMLYGEEDTATPLNKLYEAATITGVYELTVKKVKELETESD